MSRKEMRCCCTHCSAVRGWASVDVSVQPLYTFWMSGRAWGRVALGTVNYCSGVHCVINHTTHPFTHHQCCYRLRPTWNSHVWSITCTLGNANIFQILNQKTYGSAEAFIFILNVLLIPRASEWIWFIFLNDISKNAPITVAAQSKAWTAFAHSNAGIVGLSHSRHGCLDMRLLCV
jgi:hypothetical protein